MAQKLTAKEIENILNTLEERFNKNIKRHEGMDWNSVKSKLKSDPKKLWSLSEMERTGGEPDVISCDKKTDQYTFFDCSEQSPAGRRSICYDNEALAARKENKPKNSAIGMASEMGVEILTEDQYRQLQKLGKFDTKTSSWLKTPPSIRKLGGAIFADYRFETIFVYHNGADSYYAGRAFRASVTI
ncbi:MAG: DUF4256 domain-containing protein [Ginsengibacter sp.]